MSELNWHFLAIWIAWIAVIVFLARANARSPSGSTGLPLAFLCSLAFLHCGSIVYAVPDYSHWRSDGSLYLQSYNFTAETVLRGTFASFLGSSGFAIGAVLLSGRERSNLPQRYLEFALTPQMRRKTLVILLSLGVLGFVLTLMRVSFPLAQALLQVLRNLAVAAVCLGPTMIVFLDRRDFYPRWLMLAAVIPMVYVVGFGFTSYGFITFSIFAAFWVCVLARSRVSAIQVTVGSSTLIIFLLSAFVAWMSFRDKIRETIWGGAGLSERLNVISEAIASIKILRPSDFASLDLMNIRLNQNIYVGKAIEWHELYPHLKLHGENLILIPFALIPRFLWPSKPRMGGSAMLTEHTGMRFSDSATFGAGPIVEWFVNFGLYGVFFGMLALGTMIRWVDVRASRSLRSLDFLDFARWFTVGIAFVAPLTELFFMFNTAMMSFIVLTLVRHAMLRGMQPMSNGRAVGRVASQTSRT